MWFGRIGGMLVVGGCVLCLLAAAIAVGGGNADSGLDAVYQWIVPWALVPIGLGAAVLGVAGPTPLDGRAIRVGLATLGVGLLSYLFGNVVPVPGGSNNLQSWPHIILLIAGVLASVIGLIVTVVSLIRTPGPSRALGSLLLTGLLLFPCAGLISAVSTDQPFRSIVSAFVVLGFIGVFLGLIGIGVLAINGDRRAAVASA